MINGIGSIGDKLIPICDKISSEMARLSWPALVVMLMISGVIMLTGNEYGAKKIAKNAVYGWAIIQLANMLL